MTFGLLASLFLLILAAASLAGYVLVLRPSVEEGSDGRVPPSLALDSGQDLPRATAALVDIFRIVGQAMPGAGSDSANNVELRRNLIAAGYRWPSALSIYLGIKAALSLALGLAGIWLALVEQSDLGAAALAGFAGVGIGYLLPDRVLRHLASARAAKLRRSLPASLDLLVLSLEAGQGLDAAIYDTARGLRLTHPDLAAEFTLLQLEMRTGTTRHEALQNFAARGREPEMRKFANLLIDTDRFGSSLGPALKTHARYLRIRFRQIAQERARKVSVKLIFPVFFLIFPSVILVTLGPAIIQLMTQLDKMMGL